jgi:acetyl-CoA acetyltransferase
VQDALRLDLTWRLGSFEGPAQLQAVINACMAVATGLARHVLVYRTVSESSGQGVGGRQGMGLDSNGRSSSRAGGVATWFTPFGAYSTANWLAMIAQRHFYRFGTTSEQLGWLPITQRANAGRNPKSVLKDPLTMDEYLGSRMITSPFHLYDCDIPVDGSTALIISHHDAALDLPKPPIFVNAIGMATQGRRSWDQYEDMTSMSAEWAARHLWSRTDLKPHDVRVANLYDGFSILPIIWMEALGLCGRGEGGPFVDGGSRIAIDTGVFALNPHGGQLSAGRLHGYGHIHEAVVQLRGEGLARQVPHDPRVALVSNGAGPMAGCLLLTRDPP